MCGRYAIAPTRNDAWASVATELGPRLEAELAQLTPRYNITPSMEVPIIIQDPATREYSALSARWGFIPHWWRDAKLPAMTNNARIEGAESKPMWRHAWRHARCLIPVTHWYEWQEKSVGQELEQDAGKEKKKKTVKLPFALTSKDGQGFMFAGLWSVWKPPAGGESIVSAAIVTREASASVSHVHDRMPVILHPRAWTRWLSIDVVEPQHVAEILEVNTVLEARTWRVTPKMNKPIHSSPDCLDPIES